MAPFACTIDAQLAQLVEHLHGKEGVSGSSPLLGFSFHSVSRQYRPAPRSP